MYFIASTYSSGSVAAYGPHPNFCHSKSHWNQQQQSSWLENPHPFSL